MTIGSLLFPAGIAGTVLGILFLGWLAFTLVYRERHAKVTDAENSFWVRRGVIQPATAAKIARFEKGPAMKAIYAVEGVLLLLLGVLALFLHSHPRLRADHSHTDSSHQQPALSPTDKPKNSNQ
jgi:hypothetical protein